jgi:hypothetical protein
MLAAHGGSSQGIESIRVLIVFFAILVVVFWRTMLRIMIMMALALVLVLITYGALTLLHHSAHHMIK